MSVSDPFGASRGQAPELTPDVAEISLLLPGWQLEALECAARERGVTSAQLVRRLLRDFIIRHEDCEPEVIEKQNVSCQW
jgi:hypothetical protein